MRKKRVNPVGAPPTGAIRPIVNYIDADGRVQSVLVPTFDTIREGERAVVEAVQDALKSGSGVTVRFVSADTGRAISQVRVI